MKNKFLYIICGVLILMSLTSCNRDSGTTETEENTYNIYYINKNDTKLDTLSYKAKSENFEDLIKEVIEEIGKAPADAALVTAKPEQLDMSTYDLSGSLINFRFDSAYNEMTKTEEILFRTAVVKTITQIEGIEYVCFYVNEQQLTDEDGKNIGVMMASDYIENIDDAISSVSTAELTLYFANDTGDRLVPLDVEVYYSSNLSIERVIIEQLIKGSNTSGYNRTLPETMRLLSVSVKERVCYVNLDSTFLSELVNVADSIPIYSIVNSLTELDEVDAVEISVNGSNNKMFREIISLTEVFTKNEDIIEYPEEETSEESSSEEETTN